MARGAFVLVSVTSLQEHTNSLYAIETMISRTEFPYVQQLIINDAYAVKDLSISILEQDGEFKHLILTGGNGSGKTTILHAIWEIIKYTLSNSDSINRRLYNLRHWRDNGSAIDSAKKHFQDEIDTLSRVTILWSKENQSTLLHGMIKSVISTFFTAHRKVQVNDVSTITREDQLEIQMLQSSNDKSPAEFFKQYLVNKKVFQMFDALEGKNSGAKQQEKFFSDLESTLAKIFNDPGTKLEFVRENFEFYINLSDGRRFTFNQLSAGFSAFLSILTELLMRTDMLRKQANDYTYDPCGFVLIDEPETHLHLEMQYQILPLLTGLFPNLQFIVATHSPAVASSITGATVFDLSTGEVLGDQAAGSSFSELMQTHFGVENEYSNVADEIIADIKRIVEIPDHEQARQQLLKLLEEKGKYMSAGLRLEVEAQLIGLE